MKQLLKLGLKEVKIGSFIGHDVLKNGTSRIIKSPINGLPIGEVLDAPSSDLAFALNRAEEAFREWRSVPPPKRGALIKSYGELLREHKETLAEIVTLEVGKIPAEATGEVQEMIDICDMAVGQSRQLYGLTIASERSGHRLMEQWHPLGVIGVISAFNFPMAVWSWNAMLAIICGNSVVWKPSEKTPLSAIACHHLLMEAINRSDGVPDAISSVLIGGAELGIELSKNRKVALLSATGSVGMGREVAKTVSSRLGKYLLELGGNNAMVVTPSADLNLAVRAITFSAVGTTGQRCTTLRRLIVHEDLKDILLERLKVAYKSIRIGSPLEDGVIMGPLIDHKALLQYKHAIIEAEKQGGKVFSGGELAQGLNDNYVKPVIIEISASSAIVQEETFAPILYVIPYKTLDQAIAIHNGVSQGLSSSIFTSDLREAELFLSAVGSDCGIANVNIGTSGAEVGGAFGGEKDTGGGRESGSDSWKNYMRRATNTINFSNQLPLAQGVTFWNDE